MRLVSDRVSLLHDHPYDGEVGCIGAKLVVDAAHDLALCRYTRRYRRDKRQQIYLKRARKFIH